VSLDVLNVVESWGQWVVDVDDKDLPVGLSLVKQSHDTEDLDLLDLANVADSLSDLTDVQWVVVTDSASLGVLDRWVLPCLGEGTVVPDVTVVGETVSDKSELALLDVWDVSAKPGREYTEIANSPCLMGLKASSLEISILALVHRGTSTITIKRSARNFRRFYQLTVEDRLGLIGEEGDVAGIRLALRPKLCWYHTLEWGDNLPILLGEHSVLWLGSATSREALQLILTKGVGSLR
jgi:hypothetical protein